VKIVKLETFLTNCGLRNYLFVRLHTDTGLTGLGEATLEWQEMAVHTLMHEWAEERILGICPFDIEKVFGDLIRDQYQGGATVMTVISALEIACWDIVGKACGQPVYRLLGGQARDSLPVYANGWYGSARTPQDYADKARQVVAMGYNGMKFDPFEQAWKTLDHAAMQSAEDTVAAVRQAVGEGVSLMIEVHGRLSAGSAIEMGRRLAKYNPAWYEEPVSPHSLDLLAEVHSALPFPVAAGERLYMLEEFARLANLRACDVAQPDLAHCGGLWMGKKIAALCQPQDIRLAPHCSIGPVALCAAIHFGWSTPQVMVQENFGDFDAPWRSELVSGWTPMKHGRYVLPDKPGLGIELDDAACARHPFVKHAFPSLWDKRWLAEFTKSGVSA
jgi:galactonate dehydratase